MTMTGDDFRKVRSGDRLRIPARTFNSFIDAARAQRTSEHDVHSIAAALHGIAQRRVLIKNTSGQDLNRFHVLGIDQPIFTPEASETTFSNQIALKGIVPDETLHRGRFAILLEPAKANAIVTACVAGACIARVNTDDASHRFAEITTGNTARLVAAGQGSAMILWIEPGTGKKLAVVRLGNAPTPASFAVRVWRDGGSTDGDATQPCNRTYTVRTLEATGPGTGGTLLGSGMTPKKKRPPKGKLVTPSPSGAGEIGLGYYDVTTFMLFEANETLDTEACE